MIRLLQTILILATKEIRDGMRNRWVAATILLLGTLALTLSFLGSAPTGELKVAALEVSVVSLTSLSMYLLPLIALIKCPNRLEATSAAKIIGALRVVRRCAPNRLTVRSPLIRPISAAAARSLWSRAVSCQ